MANIYGYNLSSGDFEEPELQPGEGYFQLAQFTSKEEPLHREDGWELIEFARETGGRQDFKLLRYYKPNVGYVDVERKTTPWQ